MKVPLQQLRGRDVRHRCENLPPARPFPSSIFLDRNRRDIGKSQSIWTASRMVTAGSLSSASSSLPARPTLGFILCSQPAGKKRGDVCMCSSLSSAGGTEKMIEVKKVAGTTRHARS
jgi:hypothetical protein